MSYGLDASGFTKKRLIDIKGELEDEWRSAFGDDVKLTGDSVNGQLIGIMAERLAELWELAEVVYFAAYPDTATGTALDNVAAIVGVSRLPATRSTVTATLATTDGSPVTVPAGSQVRVSATGATFETVAEATIPASSTVDVELQGTETGPLEAPAGTLTEIVTPVSGWTSVTNAADAVVGRDLETDSALRLRRADEITTAQGGTIAAMEDRIRNEVDGVTYVAVAENRTDATDGDGRPPHSVHVFVIGGADQDIADKIWATKPAGANTFGAEDATVVDSFGNSQTIYWDRGSTIRIYLIANLTTDADYPADGDDLVTAVLAAYDDDLANGDDVVNWRLVSALSGIPGITDVEILQGIAPTPTLSTNIAIAANERASIAAADIIVNS